MPNKPLKSVFLWPAVVGFLSSYALLFALFEDGVIEQFSLLGLSVPILLTVYFYWIKK